MSDLELFPDVPEGAEGLGGPEVADAEGPSAAPGGPEPLAARMRPRVLEEFQGQEHLLGEGRALQGMLQSGRLASMILWGPPGSGKTTLARLLAERVGATFISLSAVSDGVARVRTVTAEASERLRATGRSTLLFCDEIHRFNKGQQDAFLPHVEAGTVILVGATTENPSFEVVRPLLSRAPVFVLEPLSAAELEAILSAALQDSERGLGGYGLEVEEGALRLVAEEADGDARRALGVLDVAARLAGSGGTIGKALLKEAVQHRFAIYDHGGEEHYNIVSALHKSIRGSDPDASLYWLARMLEGGEDPLYIARRLVRIASEDVGLSDPQALAVTLSARDSYHFLGSPEGDLALAEAVLYLAVAPKSNRTYEAFQKARASARETPAEPVPLHIRNAPTGLMRELGYGKGYRYDPSEQGSMAAQHYLPDRLLGTRFYRPTSFGFEKDVARRMRWFEERRQEAFARASEGGDGGGAGDAGDTRDGADAGDGGDAVVAGEAVRHPSEELERPEE